MKNIPLLWAKLVLSGHLCLAIVLVPAVPAKGTLPYPLFQKGMSYVTWTREGFSTPASDESLKAMAAAGVNSVAIVPTWYQEDYNSIELQATDRTPSDPSVRHAIRKAHEYGMFVMLKPHLDLIRQEGSYRGDIGFQTEDNWQKWFANYLKFITHYARMAEDENAEFFCVGTELSFAATKEDFWKDTIIPNVRKAFSGPITYAANWDDYRAVPFWDAVDYAGVDAYFPLSGNSDPTLEEIKAGWSKWLSEIEAWYNDIKKPVIFTECGYSSADSAACKPWEEAMTGAPNMRVQADCYKAVFETFWDKPWFSGIYWWNWNTYPGSGGPANRRFTPQNKLALDHIQTWYSRAAGTKIALGAAEPARAGGAELEERLKVEDAKRSGRYLGKESGIVFGGGLSGRDDKGRANPPGR